MISWWSKHIGVILSVLICDIWTTVLLHTSALVGPLHIVNWNARWNSEIQTGLLRNQASILDKNIVLLFSKAFWSPEAHPSSYPNLQEALNPDTYDRGAKNYTYLYLLLMSRIYGAMHPLHHMASMFNYAREQHRFSLRFLESFMAN
jgi:hypothetical protein